MKSFFILSLIAISTLCLYSSCERDDYRNFTRGGELVYSSRMDTVIVASGKNRLQLALVTKNDPSLDLVRIFWNDKADSVDVKTSTFTNNSHIVYISPLEDGNYNFQVYTYDKEGHSSVPFNSFGTVYGENYANSLVTRILRSTQVLPANAGVRLTWARASAGEIGTSIKYLNKQNEPVSLILHPDSTGITLSDYNENTNYTYQSLFQPEPNFIDTFFTAPVEAPFPGL